MALLNDYLRDREQQGNGVNVPNVNVAQAPQQTPAAAIGATNAQSMVSNMEAGQEAVGEQPTPQPATTTPEDVAMAEEVVDPSTVPTGVTGVDDPRYNWVPRMSPGYTPTMSDIIQRGAAAGEEMLNYEIQQFERTTDPALYDYDIYGRTALPELPRLVAPPPISTTDFVQAPDLFRNTGLGFQGQLNPTGNALQSRNGVSNENTNTLGQIVRGIFGIPEAVDSLITTGLNAVGAGGFAEWRDDNLSLRQVSRTVENVAGGQGLGEAWTNAQEGSVAEGTTQLSSLGAETVRQLGDTETSVYGSGVPGGLMRALDFPGQAIRGLGSDIVEAHQEASRAASANGGFNLGTYLTYESEYDDLEDAVNARREFSFMTPQGESGLGYTPIRESERGTFLPGGYNIPWLPGWATGLVLDAVTEIPGEALIENGVGALTRGARRQAAQEAAQALPPGALPGTLPTPNPDIPPVAPLPTSALTPGQAPVSPSNALAPPVSVFVPPSQVTNLPGAARRVSGAFSEARETPLSQVTVLGGEAATQPVRRFVPDTITVNVEAVNISEVLPTSQVTELLSPEVQQAQRSFLETATRTFQLGAARTDVQGELRQLRAAQTLDVRDLARNAYTVPQGLDVGTYDGTVRDRVQALLPASRADNAVEAPLTPDIQIEAMALAQDRAIREGVPVTDDMVRQAAEELRRGEAQGVNFDESMLPMVRMSEDEAIETFGTEDNILRQAAQRQIATEGRTIADIASDVLNVVGGGKTIDDLARVRYFDTTDEIAQRYPYNSSDTRNLGDTIKRIWGEQPTAVLKTGSRAPINGSYNSLTAAGTTRSGVVFSPNEELATLQAIAAPSPNSLSRAETPTVYETEWTPSKAVTPGTSYDTAYSVMRQYLEQAGLNKNTLRRLDNFANSKPLEQLLVAVDREVGRSGLNVEEVGFVARQRLDTSLRQSGYDAVVDSKGNVRPLVNVPLRPVGQVNNVPLAQAHGAAHDVARQLGDEVGATQHRLLSSKYVQEELQDQLNNLNDETRQSIDQLADEQQRLEARVQQERTQQERTQLQQSQQDSMLNEVDEFLEDTLFPSGDDFCV